MIEATIRFKHDVAKTAAANKPTRRVYIIEPRQKVSPTHPIAERAGKTRPANSVTPKIFMIIAVAQYWSAGFSKYSTPFKWGVIKSPVSNISRGISWYLPSSGSIKWYEPKWAKYR